ncbi:MAG TPA: hypothetical protein VMV86_01670 [Methanosarcinales archaeon]|nr:hypothetical protein [Methanosarcinales archaeon]
MTIDRGEDYLYDDFVDNIVALFEANKEALGVRFIGTAKDFLASTFPALYIIFDNASERWVAMPNKKEIGMTAIIHYYHKNLKATVRKDEIDEALGKIAAIIRKNHSCNGFLNTHQGFTVENVNAMGELRGEMGGIGDAIIEVTGVKAIRVTGIV